MIRRQEDGIIAALKSSSHPWDDPGFDGLVRTGSPSRFQDDIWEQPVHVRTQRRGHVRIPFNVELGNGECLTDPHLADLLWASKCFIWSLMHCGTRGKGGAPSTVRSSWDKFLALIKWMREYSYALLYTAITRARLRAVLIGRQSQLETAVRGEPRALMRRVGLKLTTVQ